MNRISSKSGYGIHPSANGAVVHVVWALWRFTRLAAASVLFAFEPVIRLMLLGLAVLCAGTAVLFRYSGAAPQFPFGIAMGSAASLVALLALYYLLLRLVDR